MEAVAAEAVERQAASASSPWATPLGRSAGMRISSKQNRAIGDERHHHPTLLLLLILPPDSNVESSNMASLESGCRLPLFRHRGNYKCSRCSKRVPQQRAPPISELRSTCKTCTKMVQLPKNCTEPLKPWLASPPARTTALPLPARATAATPPASVPRLRSTSTCQSECPPPARTKSPADTGPPNTNNESTVINVRPDVSTVRLRV